MAEIQKIVRIAINILRIFPIFVGNMVEIVIQILNKNTKNQNNA